MNEEQLIAVGHTLLWSEDSPYHSLPEDKQREAIGAALKANNKGQDVPAETVAQVTGNKDKATVRIQGVIAASWMGDTNVNRIIERLDALAPKAIHLLISSPGGIVGAAQSLAADLGRRRREGVALTAEALGSVASAATLPFLASDERTMTPDSEVMIHAPYWYLLAVGVNKYRLDETVARLRPSLDRRTDQLVETYARRTGQTEAQIEEWFKAGDKWMSAKEAVQLGFATRRIDDDGETIKEEKAIEPAAAAADTLSWEQSLALAAMQPASTLLD